MLWLGGASGRLPGGKKDVGPGSGAGCRALELLAARRKAGQIGIKFILATIYEIVFFL